MEQDELEVWLAPARGQIQQIAREFALEYRPESYRYLAVSREESLLRNYLAAPMYAEFGTTKAERARRIREFLRSPLYAQLTGPGSIYAEGCVLTRDELEQEAAVIAEIPDPALRGECQALYEKLAHHMQGQFLTLFGFPQPEAARTHREFPRRVEYLVLHEWLHVLLWDNGVCFQAKGKSWEWDEGLVTYLMAFSGEEDLNTHVDEASPTASLHRQYLEAGRRWREILREKRSPDKRRSAILLELEAT